MKNYKITIQYDGTRYKGWQIQKSTEDTIQGKLSHVLETLCGHEVDVIGSGRTDAGVHAIGQIANFHIDEQYTPEQILAWLNDHLPQDIAVTAIAEVPERFHARYNAVSKTYLYRIHTSSIPMVFERKYVYDLPGELDVEAMREAASFLIGTHDFRSFCGNKKMKKSTVRTITDIQIVTTSEEIKLYYTGDGFLQNMVRILTGTLIEVGRHERTPESMQDVLESRNREQAGYTVPPQGLAILNVLYDND